MRAKASAAAASTFVPSLADEIKCSATVSSEPLPWPWPPPPACAAAPVADALPAGTEESAACCTRATLKVCGRPSIRRAARLRNRVDLPAAATHTHKGAGVDRLKEKDARDR